jgi:hypothetical protein
MTLPARCDDSGPPFGTLVFDCDSTLSASRASTRFAGAKPRSRR